MNDSTENTNELDSYGVWVKNTPENEATDMPAENTLEPSDSLDFSDALDLPDFDTDTSFESSDLDDIFNDSNPLSDETPLTQDDDTTLNSDELLNITNGVDLIETEETPVIEDSFNFDDSFNIDDSLSDDSLSLDEPAVIDENLSIDDSTAFDDSLSLDDNILVDDPLSINETPVEENLSFDDPFETETVETETVDASETIAEETSDFDNSFSFDEITTEDAPALDENFADAADALVMEDSDFSLDSFETETPVETEITDEPVAETEVEAVSENETIESFGEESITVESNDDESVSIESFGDEEISLDDFMDGGFSDESVAAGNNGYEPGNPNSPSASSFVPSSSGSEEISLDDFIEGGFEVEKEKEQEVLDEKPLEMDISFDNSVDEVKTEANFSIDHDNFDDEETVDEVAVTEETSDDVIVSSSENFEAEEIDLSDFGIDADAEETPVTQDIEASKVKEQVIDYDLTVENDNAVVAPIVNEIRDNDADADNNVVEPAAESTAAVAAPAVDMSLLQQIVSELSSLKDEINHLKSNLNEIKTKEPEEPVISEDLGITENKDEGGFFGSDDTDDTIALTTDELSNIMATETFVEEPAVEESMGFAADETIISEEPVIEESPVDEPVVEETVIEESPAEEPVIEETPVIVENEGFDVVEETAVEEDDLTFATEETTDSYDFSDDELPQEIDIEKDDFITSPVDSYDSSSEITSEPTITDQSLDSTSFEENNFVSNPLEDFTTLDESEITSEPEEVTFTDVFEQTPAVEETEAVLEIEPEEDSFLSVDDTFASVEDNFTSEETVETTETSDTISDDLFVPSESEDTMTFATEPEPAAEEITSEPVIEDSDISEPIIEEPLFVEAAPVVEDVAPNEDLFVTSETKSELTDSNINYLTSDETIPSEMSSMEENTELKKDIKSVLLYMDQLLENLPEDKIVEFAKSEEFATYKKLFSELGLS